MRTTNRPDFEISADGMNVGFRMGSEPATSVCKGVDIDMGEGIQPTKSEVKARLRELLLLSKSRTFTKEEYYEFGKNLAAYRTLWNHNGNGLRTEDSLKAPSIAALNLDYGIPNVDSDGLNIQYLLDRFPAAANAEIDDTADWLKSIRLKFTKTYQAKLRTNIASAKGLIDEASDKLTLDTLPQDFPFRAEADGLLKTAKESYAKVQPADIAKVRARLFDAAEEVALKSAFDSDIWPDIDSGINNTCRFIAAAPEAIRNEVLKRIDTTKAALKASLILTDNVNTEDYKAKDQRLARYAYRPARLAVAAALNINEHPFYAMSLALTNDVNESFFSACFKNEGSFKAYVFNKIVGKSTKLGAFKTLLIEVMVMMAAVTQIATLQELQSRIPPKGTASRNLQSLKFGGIFWFVPVVTQAYIDKFQDKLIAPWFSCRRYGTDLPGVAQRHASWIAADAIAPLYKALKNCPVEVVLTDGNP